MASNDEPTHTTSLAGQSSPYLLQHAHNPVDWHPWGSEAIELARELDRPIFLSIGYSTCYWCHVMERESFENEVAAAMMNAHFVNIKLDREQRPDVDEIYMTACQVFTQMTTGRASGGWPLSVFLDSKTLQPFFVGTYFPQTRAGSSLVHAGSGRDGQSVAYGSRRRHRAGCEDLRPRGRFPAGW